MAVVQNTNQGSATTPLVVAYSSTPAQGNLLIATILNQSNATTPTVSDSNGNWTLMDGITANNLGVYIFAQIASASQPTSITADIGTGTLKMSLYEANGNLQILGSVRDVSGTGSSGTTDVTSTTTIAPSLVTTDAGDLIMTAVGLAGTTGGSESFNSSFTLQQLNTGGAPRLVDGSRIPGATGTYTPIGSWTTARRARQVTVAFKPAPPSTFKPIIAMM